MTVWLFCWVSQAGSNRHGKNKLRYACRDGNAHCILLPCPCHRWRGDAEVCWWNHTAHALPTTFSWRMLRMFGCRRLDMAPGARGVIAVMRDRDCSCRAVTRVVAGGCGLGCNDLRDGAVLGVCEMWNRCEVFPKCTSAGSGHVDIVRSSSPSPHCHALLRVLVDLKQRHPRRPGNPLHASSKQAQKRLFP